jgi:hypothetical protein
MITETPRPDPATLDLYEQVWGMYHRADDKTRPSLLRGCAAYLVAPAPVDDTLFTVVTP